MKLSISPFVSDKSLVVADDMAVDHSMCESYVAGEVKVLVVRFFIYRDVQAGCPFRKCDRHLVGR